MDDVRGIDPQERLAKARQRNFRQRSTRVAHTSRRFSPGCMRHPAGRAAAEIIGSVEPLNRFVYLNSHREEGQFAPRLGSGKVASALECGSLLPLSYGPACWAESR